MPCEGPDSIATQHAAASFPLLELPVELRLHIYRFLAPNKPVEPWTIYNPKPLRDDGEKCHPVILRVCRTIYNEALGEWYGGVEYQMFACNESIGLHPRTVIRTAAIHAGLASPHPGLRKMKTLRLHIVLPTQPVLKVLEGIDPNDCALVEEVLPTLVKWLSHQESRLREFHIRVELPPRLLHNLRLRPQDISKIYAWLLKPVHAMRGLENVSLAFVFWGMGRGVPYSSASARYRVAEFRRLGDEYKQLLVADICKKSQWSCVRS
ncbi:hypothetical protein BU16DRAFT_302832 [Lophium mytilinum]|uniref:F-box domain-containing protein n=1 Tax=Lophium mytilinum TaxID=390894 RepID=A0A6A6R2D3_9PEZI|nr:hypothetical protein BU16DRAFT_302832 [Lophium mytilinum]